MTECVFENNVAAGYGGAIYVDTKVFVEPNVTIDSCVFRRNSAIQGGAIYAGRWLKIANSLFSFNTANEGGSIYANQANAANIMIVGTTFEGNDCASWTSIYCGLGQMVISSSVFRNLNLVLRLKSVSIATI